MSDVYLYDQYINVYFYSGEEKTLSIETPLMGMKPTISFTSSLIPGGSCYNTVVRITNLDIPELEIRKWDSMEIRAGYYSGTITGAGPTSVLTAPILWAYKESPNPDGVTVFKGVAVGKVDGLLKTQTLHIAFTQSTIKIRDLVYDVCDIVGTVGYKETIKISEETLDSEINVSNMQCYANSGLEVLEWLKDTLQTWGKERGSVFLMQVTENGYVALIELNPLHPSVSYTRTDVIDLTMVSKASFTAALLQVSAPWDPRLRPGGLFYMNPSFYSGENTPNSINRSDYLDPNNIYMVIVMDVSFSTVGETNMDIKALGINHLDVNGGYEEVIKSAQSKAESETKRQSQQINNNNVDEKVYYIPSNTTPPLPDRADKNIYDLNINLPSLTSLQWGTIVQNQNQTKRFKGLNVSYLGWRSWLCVCHYAWPSKKLFEISDKEAVKMSQILGSTSPSYLKRLTLSPELAWPIVAYCTYWKRRQGGKDVSMFSTDSFGALNAPWDISDEMYWPSSLDDFTKFIPVYESITKTDDIFVTQNLKYFYAYLEAR